MDILGFGVRIKIVQVKRDKFQKQRYHTYGIDTHVGVSRYPQIMMSAITALPAAAIPFFIGAAAVIPGEWGWKPP